MTVLTWGQPSEISYDFRVQDFEFIERRMDKDDYGKLVKLQVNAGKKLRNYCFPHTKSLVRVANLSLVNSDIN